MAGLLHGKTVALTFGPPLTAETGSFNKIDFHLPSANLPGWRLSVVSPGRVTCILLALIRLLCAYLDREC